MDLGDDKQRTDISEGNAGPLKQRRFFWALALLLALCMSSLVFWQLLIQQKVYLFLDIGSDTINTFYPDMVHDRNYSLSEGESVKWSFQQGMGQNLYAGYRLHPIHLMEDYVLGWMEEAYRVGYLEWLKLMLTVLCFFAFLRLRGLHEWAGIAGALLYSFSGYMIVGGSWYGHSLVVLNTAFALFAFELLIQKRLPWLFALAVLFIGAGPGLVFFAAFLMLYMAIRYFELGWSNKQLLRIMSMSAVFGALGALINSPALVSAFFRIVDSPRLGGGEVGGGSLSQFPLLGMEGSLHYITAILRSFGNDLLGNGSQYHGWRNYLESPLFYCGLPSLLLLPQYFALNRGRKVIGLGLVLCIWFLIILFPFFRYAFYFFSSDTYKAAVSLFYPTTIVLGAVGAFDLLLRGRKLNIIVLLVSLIVLLALLNFPYTLEEGSVQGKYLGSGLLVLYSGVLLLYTKSDKGLRRLASILLLSGIALELSYISYRTVNDREMVSAAAFESKSAYRDYTVDALAFVQERENGFYRIDKDYTSSNALHYGLNDAKAQNYYGTSSYSSFNNASYIDFLSGVGVLKMNNPNDLKWLPGLSSRPILQPIASVKYNLSKSEDSFYESYGYGNRVAEFGNVKVIENKHFLPLGFCYDKYVSRASFDQLADKQKGMAMLAGFVIDRVQAPQFRNFDRFDVNTIPGDYDFEDFANDVDVSRGILNLTSFKQNNIEGSVDLERQKLLFFSIPYDRGWTAFLNGEATEIHKVNLGFMGLIVPRGKSQVQLSFNPPMLGMSQVLSVVSLLLLIGLSYWMGTGPKFGKKADVSERRE